MADRVITAVFQAEDRLSSSLKVIDGRLRELDRGAHGLRDTLLSFGGAFVAFKVAESVLGGVARELNRWVEAASEAEQINVRLAVALRNAGLAVTDNLRRYDAFADQLMQVTGIDDELIKQNLQLLISFGRLRGEGLERATKAAADWAATGRITMVDAAMVIAKAAQGSTAALQRYGIVVGDNIEPARRLDVVLTALEGRFSGQAAARLTTYAGQMDLLRANVENLREALGSSFVEVGQIVLAQFLNPTISGLTSVVKGTDVVRQGVFGVALAFVDLGEGVLRFVDGPGQALRKWIERLGGLDRIIQANIDFVRLVAPYVAYGAIGQAGGLFGAGTKPGAAPGAPSQLTTALFTALDDTRKALEAARLNPAFTRLAQSIEGLADTTTTATETIAESYGIAPPWMGTPEEIAASDAAIKAAYYQPAAALNRPIDLADLFASEEEFLDFLRQVEGLETSIAEQWDAWVTDSIQQAGIQAIREFSSQLAQAFVTGELRFGEMIRSILAGLAQMIIQVLLFRSIMTALSFSFGGGGLFGVGLMARGGIVPGRAPLHAQTGMLIRGYDRGHDTVPILARPGEAVLPADLTRALMRGSGRAPVDVHLHGDLANLVDRIDQRVRGGSLRLASSATVSTRTVR